MDNKKIISLSTLGFMKYYVLDIKNEKIFSFNNNKYLNPIAPYRYRLKTTEGKYKSITLKEIYKKLLNKVFCKDNVKRLDNEVFKPIEGTNELYYISNKGRVLSYKGNEAVILKGVITDKGYNRVMLQIEGRQVNKFIHSLVAEAFLEPPPNLDYSIHHLDYNKNNNNLNNLCYAKKSIHSKIHSFRNKGVAAANGNAN